MKIGWSMVMDDGFGCLTGVWDYSFVFTRDLWSLISL